MEEKSNIIEGNDSLNESKLNIKRLIIVGKFIIGFSLLILGGVLYLIVTNNNQFENSGKYIKVVPSIGFFFILYYVFSTLKFFKDPIEYSFLQNLLNKVSALVLLLNGIFYLFLGISRITSGILGLLILCPLTIYGLSMFYYVYHTDRCIYKNKKNWFRLEWKIFLIVFIIIPILSLLLGSLFKI
jgi:hypothetical protein